MNEVQIRRIVIKQLDKKKEDFRGYQAALQMATTCVGLLCIPNRQCHNEAINKFNMEQLIIDKVLTVDMRK